MRPSTSSSSTSSSSLLDPPRTPSKPTYIRSGIGGAGNWRKASEVPPNSTGSAAPLLVPPHPRSTGHFTSGIGGAGNIHQHSERNTLDFAEELARGRAVERNVPASFHVGIGGAGNFRSREKRRNAVANGLGGRRSEGDLFAASDSAAAHAAPTTTLPASNAGSRESAGSGSGDECSGCTYSSEPLPYGALDILRRRLGQTFTRGREVPAASNERSMHGRSGEERRHLRSHRSMWRF